MRSGSVAALDRRMSTVGRRHLRHQDGRGEQRLDDADEVNAGTSANLGERSGERLDALVLLRIVNGRWPNHSRR